MKKLNEQQQEELRSILDKNDDPVLQPKKVVAHAKNPKSSLHDCFEWDNSKAGEQWRLEQARRLIRFSVIVLENPNPTVNIGKIVVTDAPEYVSLKSDRIRPGGGYRVLKDVLEDDNLRDELLEQALDELNLWKKKYKKLKELSAIFIAADVVQENISKKKKAIAV